MLCGETPFTGSSPQEIARKHVELEPPPLAERAPDAPPEVLGLVSRLMAKDPEERLPCARQLQADLAELARRYPLRETVLLRIDAVAPDEPPSDALLEVADPPPVDRSALAYAGLALVAIALLAGAFLVTRLLMGDQQKRLAEAWVKVLPADDRRGARYLGRGQMFDWSVPKGATRADAAGAFQLKLKPGTYVLAAGAKHCATAVVASSRPPIPVSISAISTPRSSKIRIARIVANSKKVGCGSQLSTSSRSSVNPRATSASPIRRKSFSLVAPATMTRIHASRHFGVQTMTGCPIRTMVVS